MTYTARTSHRGAQSQIRHQGRRPTCAVFAATAAHEWVRADGIDLSEESNLWGAKQLDGIAGEATSTRHALQALESHGQVEEATWPYGSPVYSTGPPTAVTSATWHKTSGTTDLGTLSFDGIEEALASKKRLVLSLSFVQPAWYSGVAQRTGFVTAPLAAVIADGHAITAVGVGTFDNTDVIEFKNSWGHRWGDHGYGYLDADYWERYSRRAFAVEQ
jgi:C1A family cysteine protease